MDLTLKLHSEQKASFLALFAVYALKLRLNWVRVNDANNTVAAASPTAGCVGASVLCLVFAALNHAGFLLSWLLLL